MHDSQQLDKRHRGSNRVHAHDGMMEVPEFRTGLERAAETGEKTCTVAGGKSLRIPRSKLEAADT